MKILEFMGISNFFYVPGRPKVGTRDPDLLPPTMFSTPIKLYNASSSRFRVFVVVCVCEFKYYLIFS